MGSSLPISCINKEIDDKMITVVTADIPTEIGARTL